MLAHCKNKRKHEIIYVWSAAWWVPVQWFLSHSSCLMSHYLLSTEGTGFCQSLRPSKSGRNEIADTEGIFLPSSLGPRWWNQQGKLSSLLAGVPSLMCSSSVTKMGFRDLLHLCLCAEMMVWVGLKIAERCLGKACNIAQESTLSCTLHTVPVLFLTCFGMVLFVLDLGQTLCAICNLALLKYFPSTSWMPKAVIVPCTVAWASHIRNLTGSLLCLWWW